MPDQGRSSDGGDQADGVPEPHPEPPADLPSRVLPEFDVTSMPTPWFRLHATERAPLYFGRTARGRFNAPTGEFGVLYLAADPFGAFVETLGQATGVGVVEWAVVARRTLSRVTTSRPLMLVDLTGPGLAQIGADARLCTGDHALAQRWSLHLWRHPSSPDGLVYRARHDPERFSIAIYDRAADAIEIERQLPLHREHAWLARMLERYGFSLVVD